MGINLYPGLRAALHTVYLGARAQEGAASHPFLMFARNKYRSQAKKRGKRHQDLMIIPRVGPHRWAPLRSVPGLVGDTGPTRSTPVWLQ